MNSTPISGAVWISRLAVPIQRCSASSLAAPAISVARLVTSRQVTDVHLVNLAAASGAVLAILDRGIERMLEPAGRERVFVPP